MQQRNAYLGANSTFVNACMTLNSFQVGIPPETVCVFISFLFVLVFFYNCLSICYTVLCVCVSETGL